jgi:hypothetical protein
VIPTELETGPADVNWSTTGFIEGFGRKSC